MLRFPGYTHAFVCVFNRFVFHVNWRLVYWTPQSTWLWVHYQNLYRCKLCSKIYVHYMWYMVYVLIILLASLPFFFLLTHFLSLPSFSIFPPSPFPSSLSSSPSPPLSQLYDCPGYFPVMYQELPQNTHLQAIINVFVSTSIRPWTKLSPTYSRGMLHHDCYPYRGSER